VPRSPSIPTQWLGLLAVVVGNLFPLLGVSVWGWNLTSLLVIYWFEALTTALLAAIKALFAKQGSPELYVLEPMANLRAKRGGLQPRSGWPPIYPRNLPFAVSILGVWCIAVLPMSLLAWLSLDLTPTVSGGLLVALAALVASHLTDFRVDYIGTERYTNVSAQELTRTPAQQVLVLFCLLPFITGETASGAVLIGGVVLAKTAGEAYRFYVDHMGQPLVAVTDWLQQSTLIETESLQEPPPEIELPDSPVDGRVTTDTAAIILGSIPDIMLGLVSDGGILLGAVLIFGIAIDSPLVVGFAVAVLLAIVAVAVLSRWLRFGTIEYQRRDHEIVAYDRLLAEPQWVTPVYRGDIEVKNAIPDRLLGTGTVTLSTPNDDDKPVTLGPVPDLDAAVDELALPIRQPRRPETEYTVVAAAAGLLAVFAVLPVVVLTVGDLDTGTAIAVLVFAAPLLFPLVGGLLLSGLSRL
jgi:membrane protein YdbS with pleckstrin-like domain